MDTPLKLKFWGTRGLISSPHKDKAVHGGNTTSIQIIYKDHLIVVDTGFGVTNLGEILMERILKNNEHMTIHIFYTHYHWDHIQGLPFFHPIYFPTTTMNIYSPLSSDHAKEQLDVLFDGSYSPFAGINSMPSKLNFHEIKKSLEIDQLEIDFSALDHGWNKNLTYAYRFKVKKGPSLVIATDHEARPGPHNDSLLSFAKHCDLLVHDGQYFAEEYKDHQDWGHSSVDAALDNGIQCKAKSVLLTHHSPQRTDKMIESYKKDLKKQSKFKNLDFDFAKESIIYPVGKK